MQRLFFHSFPRPRKGEARRRQLQKGSRIAYSVLENGLLLSPENYDLPVLGNDRFTLDSFSAVQRRICFTELEPKELAEHGKIFGPFALAYRIEDLRGLGALPVFYVPLESGGYLSGLAVPMLGGLVDAHRITSTLLMIQRQLSESPALGLKYRGKEINFSPEQADVIRSFLDVLADSAGTGFDATDARLRTMASCFYPTENPQYTQPLHYYRQREWRIIAGVFTFNGQPFSFRATEPQVETLLAIDRDFFSKKLSFFDSGKNVGEKISDSIANRCHFLQRVGDLDAVAIARCLIIPDDLSDSSELQKRFVARDVEVISADVTEAAATDHNSRVIKTLKESST